MLNKIAVFLIANSINRKFIVFIVMLYVMFITRLLLGVCGGCICVSETLLVNCLTRNHIY